MPRYREKPIHPLVQKIWEEQGISGPKEAANRSGVDLNIVALSADVDRVDNLIDRVARWAEKLGLEPTEFSERMTEYIHEKYKTAT